MKVFLPVLLLILCSAVSFAEPNTRKPGDRGPADNRPPQSGTNVAPGADALQGAAGDPAARGTMSPQSNPLFAALDTDGDGIISKKELAKAAISLKKLDLDGDGNITWEEVMQAGGGQIGVGAVNPAGANAPHNWGPAGQEADQLIARYDRNKDGKLSPEELPAQMRQMLQNADANNDGFIDRDELAAAMQQMRTQNRNGAGAYPNNPAAMRRTQEMQQRLQRGPGNQP